MVPVDEMVRQATYLPPAEVRELITRLEEFLAGQSSQTITPKLSSELLPKSKSMAEIRAELINQTPDQEKDRRLALAFKNTFGMWADRDFTAEEYEDSLRGNRGGRFKA